MANKIIDNDEVVKGLEELMDKYSLDIRDMMHLAFLNNIGYMLSADLELVEQTIKNSYK